MLRTFTLQVTIVLLFVLLPLKTRARDYIIYSVSHELPMGFNDKVPMRNFYVNLGENQGAAPGITLDIFRVISRMDSHTNKKRYNHQVKIGELEVLHAESESSITILKQIFSGAKTPLFNIDSPMIGDYVTVNVK